MQKVQYAVALKKATDNHDMTHVVRQTSYFLATSVELGQKPEGRELFDKFPNVAAEVALARINNPALGQPMGVRLAGTLDAEGVLATSALPPGVSAVYPLFVPMDTTQHHVALVDSAGQDDPPDGMGNKWVLEILFAMPSPTEEIGTGGGGAKPSAASLLVPPGAKGGGGGRGRGAGRVRGSAAGDAGDEAKPEPIGSVVKINLSFSHMRWGESNFNQKTVHSGKSSIFGNVSSDASKVSVPVTLVNAPFEVFECNSDAKCLVESGKLVFMGDTAPESVTWSYTLSTDEELKWRFTDFLGKEIYLKYIAPYEEKIKQKEVFDGHKLTWPIKPKYSAEQIEAMDDFAQLKKLCRQWGVPSFTAKEKKQWSEEKKITTMKKRMRMAVEKDKKDRTEDYNDAFDNLGWWYDFRVMVPIPKPAGKGGAQGATAKLCEVLWTSKSVEPAASHLAAAKLAAVMNTDDRKHQLLVQLQEVKVQPEFQFGEDE